MERAPSCDMASRIARRGSLASASDEAASVAASRVASIMAVRIFSTKERLWLDRPFRSHPPRAASEYRRSADSCVRERQDERRERGRTIEVTGEYCGARRRELGVAW